MRTSGRTIMADDPAGRGANHRRLRLVTPKPLSPLSPHPLSAVPARRMAVTPVPPRRTLWTEELMRLVRAEVDTAVRSGVISAAESEQLLARLSLVVDQALGPS
jgi:hypothetical protein